MCTQKGVSPQACAIVERGCIKLTWCTSCGTKEEHQGYTIYYIKPLITECYNMLQFNYFRDHDKIIVAIYKTACHVEYIERQQT